MRKIKNVAIIGGGISGLAAGGFLSRKGLKVSLFEANDKLGGSCADTEMDGFRFNDGALFLVLPGVLDQVFEKLGLDRRSLLPLRKITSNRTTILPDDAVVFIGDGLDIRIENGDTVLDANRLKREINRLLKKWEPVLRLFENDIMVRPFSFSRLAAKGWRHLPKFRGTVASELGKMISDDRIRASMAGTLLFSGVPPQKTPVTAILGLAAMLVEGYYFPEGGMGRVPETLSRALKDNGGGIFLNTKVDKIVTKNKKITGLVTASGEFVEADAVISTVSGMITFDRLLNPDAVPDRMKRKVRRAPLSHKAMAVQLGLRNKLDHVGHLNNVLPMMDSQQEIFIRDDDDVIIPFYSVPTVTVPELAPRGGSVLEIFPLIRQEIPADDWDEGKKQSIVDMAIKKLSESHVIDIAVTRAVSPKDFQDRMRLYKGAIYGLSPAAGPGALFPHRSGIEGLYLAGQTTFPGYGVSPSAMSGILAAESLLKDCAG